MENLSRILSYLIENRMYIYAISFIICFVISYAFELFLTKYKKVKDVNSSLSRMQRIQYPKIGTIVYLYNPNTDRYGYVEIIKAKIVSVLHKGQYFVISELNTDEEYMYSLKHSQLVYINDVFVFVLDNTSLKPRIGDMIRIYNPSDYTETSDIDVQHGYFTLTRVMNPKKVIVSTPDSEIAIPLSVIKYSDKNGYTV